MGKLTRSMFFITGSLVLLLSSCKRDSSEPREETEKTVKVTVKHPRTGEALAGVKGNLILREAIYYDEATGQNIFSYDFETGSDGSIEISDKLKNLGSGFSVTYSGNDGIWNDTYSEGESEILDDVIYLTLYVVPEAWVIINYENISNQYEGIAFNHSDSVIWGYGQKGSYVYVEEGDRDHYVQYYLYEKNIYNSPRESKGSWNSISSADTNLFSIQY